MKDQITKISLVEHHPGILTICYYSISVRYYRCNVSTSLTCEVQGFEVPIKPIWWLGKLFNLFKYSGFYGYRNPILARFSVRNPIVEFVSLPKDLIILLVYWIGRTKHSKSDEWWCLVLSTFASSLYKRDFLGGNFRKKQHSIFFPVKKSCFSGSRLGFNSANET